MRVAKFVVDVDVVYVWRYDNQKGSGIRNSDVPSSKFLAGLIFAIFDNTSVRVRVP